MASIDLALKYLQSLGPEEKINYTQIAKKFGVDRSTLSRRYRQVNGSKEDQYYTQALLGKEQSAVLITVVDGFAERGASLSNARLAEFAKLMTGKEPGKNWASRWLKQHSDQLIPVQQRDEDEEEDHGKQALMEELMLLKLEREILKLKIAKLGDKDNE